MMYEASSRKPMQMDGNFITCKLQRVQVACLQGAGKSGSVGAPPIAMTVGVLKVHVAW